MLIFSAQKHMGPESARPSSALQERVGGLTGAAGGVRGTRGTAEVFSHYPRFCVL